MNMDDDFSATVIFDSPFGEIITTCKKLLQFNQDVVTDNNNTESKPDSVQPVIYAKPKKSVTWDNKLIPEELEKEKKKVSKSVVLSTPKAPVPNRLMTKDVPKLPAIVSHFMTVKKNRTKVFSGNIQIRVREIPTLLAMCIRCIDTNKEKLLGFGLLSGGMITKVLRRATVNQLLAIEKKEPSLIEGKKTDDLWKLHYEKDFKIVPKSSSTKPWRSLYLEANNSKTNKIDQTKKKDIKSTTSSSVTSKSVSTSLRKSSVIILPENNGKDDIFSQALNQVESSKRKRSNDLQKTKKKRRSD